MRRNGKRIVMLLLGAALFCQAQIGALAAQEGEYAGYLSGRYRESGEEGEYQVISVSTEEDLAQLAQNCRMDSWSLDKKVELSADIVLREYRDLCIPSFAGIFAGNGHTISNLEIVREGSAVGLFRYVQQSGEVRDLTVSGHVAPEGTKGMVGGIVGVNYGKIYHCSFSGSVEGDGEVGGIAGVSETSGELEKCSSDATVQGNHSVGGIVGSNHGTVRSCVNTGSVNAYSTEVAYGLEDITIEEIQDINSTDHLQAHTDSGGIAGISDGSIYSCTNTGTVGYSHVGYNTGGIAGRLHQGYIQDCNNDGRVMGRKDVGGIAGQMEPFLEVEYMEDRLQELDRETTAFRNLLERTHNDLNSYGQQTTDILNDLSDNLKGVNSARESMEDAAEDLKNIHDSAASGEEQRARSVEALNQSMNGAGDNLDQLIQVLESGGEATNDNVNALIDQSKALQDTMEALRDDLVNFEGLKTQDTSDEEASTGSWYEGGTTEDYFDAEDFQQGKIVFCTNRGTVEADANVGGIVGQIATEYDFDPEDDIAVSGEVSLNVEASGKAVVRDSRNLGDVSAKKDYAGGIAGKAEFGALISCESYGAVESTGGSYAGGIAGGSHSMIRSCSSMGEVSGKNYIGGIVGQGQDVLHSYAYPTLNATGEGRGSIAGALREEGILQGNYYVENGVGAIDGISYAGGAAPMAYREFCALEGIPEAFTGFTVTFMAEGRELACVQCSYGDSLSADQIPEIPEKEGYYGVWPEFDFDHIVGSRVLEVQYEKWITTLSSSGGDEKGRPRVLVQGHFVPGENLLVTEAEEEITFAIGETPGENRYHDPVEVHVLWEEENAAVEVRTEGGYVPVESSRLGSYLVFNMEEPGTFRVVPVQSDNGLIGGLVVCGVLAVALVAVVLVVKKKKGGKKS